MKMYCNYVIKFIFIISFETLDYKELVYSIFSLPLTHIAMNFEVNINIRAYPDFLFISRKKKSGKRNVILNLSSLLLSFPCPLYQFHVKLEIQTLSLCIHHACFTEKEGKE